MTALTHTFAERKIFLNDLENKSKEKISLFLRQKPTLSATQLREIEDVKIESAKRISELNK